MKPDELIIRQREFYMGGATREICFRIECLKRLKKAIVAYEDKINEALWQDLHKSAYESYLTEISIVLQELSTHIRHLRKWAKPRRVPTPVHLFGSRCRVVYEPLGAVLIMAPWNYPFQLLMAPLIGAVSAGNCAILKPSPYTPRVAQVMAELIASVFEERHVAVVQGDREVNQALLAQRFDYIFFTGGAVLGRIVMRAAADFLTPMTLELGGKSPCIVDEGADIDLAAKRLAWGKCLNAGQTCIAPDYLFVHREVKNRLLEKVKHYIGCFYGADPKDSPDYPRIVRPEAVDRITALMKRGNIVWGGESDRESRYIAPTCIDGVRPEDPIMQEEIFGPVLPVMEYSSLEEAIRYINGHEKPLALYYFGRPEIARDVIARTSSGGVCVNDVIMHVANHHLPFGGVGNSGTGKYHGFYSFETFSNRRAVLYASTWLDIPFKYAPYKNLGLLKKMMR